MDPTIADVLQILDEHYGKQYGDVVRKNLDKKKQKKAITIVIRKPKDWVMPTQSPRRYYHRVGPHILKDRHAPCQWLLKFIEHSLPGMSITRTYKQDLLCREVVDRARAWGLVVSYK